MPRVYLTDDDINAIKAARGKMSIMDIADRYKIGFNRIYKILKSVPDDIPVERIIDNEDEKEINQIVDQVGDLTVNDNNNETIKSLQRENDNLINKIKSLQRVTTNTDSVKIKSLQRELTDTQEQLDDVTQVRDRLRIKLSDVRSQLNATQHDNRLLITQYDNLSEKYSALAVEVNNSHKRVSNGVEHKPKKKKKPSCDDQLWKKPTRDSESQKQFEQQQRRDFIAQLDIERLQEQTRKKLTGKP